MTDSPNHLRTLPLQGSPRDLLLWLIVLGIGVPTIAVVGDAVRKIQPHDVDALDEDALEHAGRVGRGSERRDDLRSAELQGHRASPFREAAKLSTRSGADS